MEINADHMILDAVREGIANAVKVKIEGYDSPLKDIIKTCIAKHEPAIHAVINEAVAACVLDEGFREEIKQSTRVQLARNLVQRIGGEIEKQVNVLKADPTTRARITMAIDTIVKEKTNG